MALLSNAGYWGSLRRLRQIGHQHDLTVPQLLERFMFAS